MMNLSYRRCSTEEQHNGPVAQADRIAAWAKSQNVSVEKDFFDDGVSGSVPLADRPEGARMLEALKPGGVVIVAKLDRLFRSVADAAITLDEWGKAGIKFVSITENFDMTSPYGKAMIHIMSALAELERAMIRERTKAALASKKARGERVGTVPYGFEAEGGKLIENSIEQAALAEMKAWRACGMTLRQIATKLNVDGVSAKRGGVWRAQSVASVLKGKGA